MDEKVRMAVRELESLDGNDPEVAHSLADKILLANVDPAIAAAYDRLVRRCGWWAS